MQFFQIIRYLLLQVSTYFDSFMCNCLYLHYWCRTANCVHFLPFFKRLSHLSIDKSGEISQVFEFINACPNIFSINFVDNLPPSSTAVTEMSNAPSSYYSQRLKSLKLWLTKLQDPHTSCLMWYPHSHLDTLYIDMNNVNFNKW